MVSAEQAIAVINTRFGKHPKFRALHAKGIVCRGTFTATPEAAPLTRAAHMQGPEVEAIVRVSNGGGDPTVPDYAPDVRGLAVAFVLPDGSRTVISAQTVPKFPVSSSEAFLAMIKALTPGVAAAWRLPAFLARNPRAAASLPTNAKALRLPRSYASVPYYAVHAFTWVAADGSRRSVRYHWVPQAGEQRISASAAKAAGVDYLGDELRTRLAVEPVHFDLRVQIAEPGDDTADPSAQWPPSRRVVTVGTLRIEEIVPEQGVLVFDPTSVLDGIELSDDPVLRFRAPVYSVSVDDRLA